MQCSKDGFESLLRDFDRLLEVMTRLCPPPEPSQMPITSQLVGINPDGIATLANGTYWRIAPGDLARAKKWLTGAEVTVTPTDVHKPIRKVNLKNIDTGERVAAVQSNSPPK